MNHRQSRNENLESNEECKCNISNFNNGSITTLYTKSRTSIQL